MFSSCRSKLVRLVQRMMRFQRISPDVRRNLIQARRDKRQQIAEAKTNQSSSKSAISESESESY